MDENAAHHSRFHREALDVRAGVAGELVESFIEAGLLLRENEVARV
jgi:hypothetical protein